MSAFTQAAALVKSAVLSTFGEQVTLLDSDKTTVLATLQGHVSTRVIEADEFQSVTTEVRMIKLDRAQSHQIRSGRYIRQRDGKVYKLTEPADPGKFSRSGVNTSHFVYWYLI